MEMLRRMFGLGPKKRDDPAPYTLFTNEGGDVRVQMGYDKSGAGAMARHNFGMILGWDNVPADIGMQPVIEVKDVDAWVPISGSKGPQPDLQTQMNFLQGWTETGIIGPQPINPEGSMATGADEFLAPAAAPVMVEPIGPGTLTFGAGAQPVDPFGVVGPMTMPVVQPSAMDTGTFITGGAAANMPPQMNFGTPITGDAASLMPPPAAADVSKMTDGELSSYLSGVVSNVAPTNLETARQGSAGGIIPGTDNPALQAIIEEALRRSNHAAGRTGSQGVGPSRAKRKTKFTG